MSFAKNLRDELNYQNLLVKELSSKTGINIHTLSHYLSGKETIPPADTAVKIATALGVTVEYLVTGIAQPQPDTTVTSTTQDMLNDLPTYIQFREMLSELLILPDTALDIVKTLVKILAIKEQNKN